MGSVSTPTPTSTPTMDAEAAMIRRERLRRSARDAAPGGGEFFDHKKDLGGGIVAHFNGREIRLSRRVANPKRPGTFSIESIYLDRIDALMLRKYIVDICVPVSTYGPGASGKRWVF